MNGDKLCWRAWGDACVEANARALRDLLAFLLSNGVACATRARIASAAAELLENVARHAYPDAPGPFRLEAIVLGSRLRLEVADDGLGLDPACASEAGANTLSSGLARARALAETMRISTTPSGGACVELEFALSSSVFADERGVDLSDHDYLDPALSRRVLSALRDGSLEPQFQLSPALAVCVGRLLSARAEERNPLAELWS
ncbi:MAG TPA: ATP-binding protein [Planctomycetota bacterium]|nr:ATP-binding protein [Planctomycetota bacterium]